MIRIRAAKPKLLLLSSDAPLTQMVSNAARAHYQVVATLDARWAMAWLAQYADVAVFVADGAGADVAAVLGKARAMRPDVVRVLCSDDAGTSLIPADASDDAAHYVLPKPLDVASLRDVLAPQHIGFEVSPHRLSA